MAFFVILGKSDRAAPAKLSVTILLSFSSPQASNN
jgi:hypothetical protein